MSYDDLFLQRRMKRAHSTQQERNNKDHIDLTFNKARLKRRSAVVHTMLQASVQLSLCYVQQLYNVKLEQPKQSAF